jgi:hypothetical protein
MRTLSVVAVLLLVAACQNAPPEMTEAEIAQIEAEVLEAMEANLEGWRQHSADMIMATFHPTATSWVVGSTPRDFGEVTDWVRNFFEGYTNWEGGWAETSVTVLSQDAALFQGTYDCTTTRNDGRMLFWPGNATWTNLLERTEDGWRITKGANSAGAGQRIDQLFGIYDWVPSEVVPGGLVELRPDGSWTSTVIPTDGSDPIVEEGRFTLERRVEGCFPFEARSNETPDDPVSGTICDGVLMTDDGDLVANKRQ